MPCYKPIEAYISLNKKTKNGKALIVFKRKDAGRLSLPISLPCGRCIGCRIDKSRDWAVRSYHESSLFNYNSFITLTYDENHIPENNNLVKDEISKFMKEIRRDIKGIDIVSGAKNPYPIRYFGCGEYGENFSRPHYHICLFNYDFLDRYYWAKINGNKYYRSETLEKYWIKGISLISDFTFKTAAYVARYITKKIGGDKAKVHYAIVEEESGEIKGYRNKEYVAMSRMPGIGNRWIKKYNQEVYNKDYVVVDGKIYSTPAYYDKVYETLNPEHYRAVKRQRIEGSVEHAIDNTKRRLVDRRKVAERKYEQLVRGFENESTNLYYV